MQNQVVSVLMFTNDVYMVFKQKLVYGQSCGYTQYRGTIPGHYIVQFDGSFIRGISSVENS